MKVNEFFKNVFSYANGIEQWCKNFLMQTSGTKLTYTFTHDFAIADWYGEKSVRESYNRIKKSWISDYKAFTEVAMSLNVLSWANDQLAKQGIEGREKYIELYSELWFKAKDDFYKKYGKNEEACDYFFNMTN
jgi:hypothetical protein